MRDVVVPEANVSDARQVHRRRKPRRTSLPVGLGALPALLAVGTTIAVAVIALSIESHQGSNVAGGSTPTLPPAPALEPALPPTESGYLQTAKQAAVARDPACSTQRVPPVNHGSPSRGLLSILGVLRRPTTPADKLGQWFLNDPHNEIGGVYVNYVRLARRADGNNFYIVPVSAGGFRPVPERCYGEEAAALAREQMSAASRAQILQYLAWERSQDVPHEDGICFAEVSPRGGASIGCGSQLSAIERHGTLTGDGVLMSGVVPDGVASVTLRFPKASVTARAVDNVFVAREPRGDNPPPRIAWRSADGTIIKTIRPSVW